jgi:hypothetical protein
MHICDKFAVFVYRNFPDDGLVESETRKGHHKWQIIIYDLLCSFLH